ncbi:MAG: hypothetical protein AB1505_07880 [Candidatus Latescibacterota bacterium]
MPITLERVASSERTTLEDLFRVKFAEEGTDRDPEALRKWAQWIDDYFVGTRCVPLVARAADETVAFAIVRLGCTPAGADGRTPEKANLVEEFHVLPSHRSTGMGTRVGDAIFRAYPGRWMATTWPHGMGVGFWRHVATGCRGVMGREYAPGEHTGFPGLYVWIVESVEGTDAEPGLPADAEERAADA